MISPVNNNAPSEYNTQRMTKALQVYCNLSLHCSTQQGLYQEEI